MVRRMDRQGEVLIWCRKCSEHARQRMGPKLMNCCEPEQVGTKVYGKMLKRIQVLEGQDRKQGTRRSKDKRGELPEWNTEDCGMSLKCKDSWHRKVYGISPKRKCCRTEVHCLKKETLAESTRPCMTRISLAEGGCGRLGGGVMPLRNFSDVEDSDSCGNSWCDLLEDYCGVSECVLEVSSGVLVVTDVPDHLLRCL